MKELKVLEAIKRLINHNDVEFILVEKANMIYIDYGSSQHNLIPAYDISKKIAKLFDTEVIFRFNGYDIFVQKNTKEEDVCKQYKRQSDIDYENYTIDVFTKASRKLNVNNVKRKTSQALLCIENQNGFKSYIPNYQLNQLSKEIVNLYKSNIPDSYLDEMVEEAKILKKTKA